MAHLPLGFNLILCRKSNHLTLISSFSCPTNQKGFFQHTGSAAIQRAPGRWRSRLGGWWGAAAPGCQKERTCAVQEAPSSTGPVPNRQTAAVTVVPLKVSQSRTGFEDLSHAHDHKPPRRVICFGNEADQTLVAHT